MKFTRHRSADDRIRSAIALIKLVLQENADLLHEHRKEILNIALWKLTEAECDKNKYQTRFISVAALESKSNLRHDHVFQREVMIKKLLDMPFDEVEEIVAGAVGCTVTYDEHLALNLIKSLDGWERYKKVGIKVMDRESGELLQF